MREQQQEPGGDSFSEIRDDAINERIQEALAQLAELDRGIQESHQRLVQLSRDIQADSRLDDAARDLIERYMDEFACEVGVQFKRLYKLGAEDCVRLLRELGVLR